MMQALHDTDFILYLLVNEALVLLIPSVDRFGSVDFVTIYLSEDVAGPEPSLAKLFLFLVFLPNLPSSSPNNLVN